MKAHVWNVALVLGVLSAGACGGTSESAGGDGDGDASGDGDVAGDGDTAGDGDVVGDGDVSGDGDTAGDGDVVGDGDVGGDGDGDVVGDGDVGGDGDGDVVGDGDVGGDGDLIVCTDEYVYGLEVRVMGGAVPVPQPFIAPPGDGDLGELIPPPTGGVGNVGDECAATVVAVDGEYMETLMCSVAPEGSGDCMCYGAGERAGVYDVTATLEGQSHTQTVEVGRDVCHVIPELLVFFGTR